MWVFFPYSYTYSYTLIYLILTGSFWGQCVRDEGPVSGLGLSSCEAI